MQDKQNTNWLPLMVGLFLCWQLWQTQSTQQNLKEQLTIYQQREIRTNEVIDKLRGFNR